jgi:hypothetical protein
LRAWIGSHIAPKRGQVEELSAGTIEEDDNKLASRHQHCTDLALAVSRAASIARHPEAKYGFIVLTGDMIFKHFFVGVKLLLGHKHLSSAAADNRQNQLTCHVLKTELRGGRLAHRSTDEASSSFPFALRISLSAAALLAALV